MGRFLTLVAFSFVEGCFLIWGFLKHLWPSYRKVLRFLFSGRLKTALTSSAFLEASSRLSFFFVNGKLETFETVGDNSGRIRRGASLRKSDSHNGKDDKATPVGGSQRERRSLLDVAGDREIVTQFEIKRSWVQGECIALCSCNMFVFNKHVAYFISLSKIIKCSVLRIIRVNRVPKGVDVQRCSCWFSKRVWHAIDLGCWPWHIRSQCRCQLLCIMNIFCWISI